MHQVNCGWQDIFNPIPVDGMGMPAAYFHKLERPTCAEQGDLFGQPADQARVAIFIDKFHHFPLSDLASAPCAQV